jgi:hypothetical protein
MYIYRDKVAPDSQKAPRDVTVSNPPASYKRCEVLTAGRIQVVVFWVLTP